MQLLILSDIHGNLTALEAVLQDAAERSKPDAAAFLGDFIDYGMRYWQNWLHSVFRNSANCGETMSMRS